MAETLAGPIKVRQVSATKTLPPNPPSNNLPVKRFPKEDGLTVKQRSFLNYYCRSFNAYRSALQAGYSESVANVATSEILYKPAVQKELRRRLEERFRKEDFTAEQVLQKIQACSEWNIADYIEVDENGTFHYDLRNVDRYQMEAISGAEIDPQGRLKLHFESRKAWTDLKAKILKLTDKDSKHGDDSQPLTQEYFDALLQKAANNNILVQNITINNTQKETQTEPKTLEAEVTQ